MNRKNQKFLIFLFLAGSVGTAILMPPPLPGQQCQPPVNLTIAKREVAHYYESGCYQKELAGIIDRAIAYFKTILVGKKTTVIFDIDETVLSNYEDEKTIAFGYIPKESHKWVLEADSPGITETKKLYDYLVGRGFTIIFMTGRKYDEYEATLKNLKREGFTKFEKLIVRSKDEEKLSAEQYKSARRKKLTEQGYRIVGCVGDQLSDLRGDYAGHTIKVPNYRYMIE